MLQRLFNRAGLGPDLDIDLERLRETESQSLLVHLLTLRHRLFAALDTAEEHGDGGMLASLSSLLGDLAVGRSSVTNILISPAYVELRHALVNSLAPFPDARQAVAALLHRLEGKAADAIRTDARTFAGPLTIEHQATPPVAQPLPPPPC